MVISSGVDSSEYEHADFDSATDTEVASSAGFRSDIVDSHTDDDMTFQEPTTSSMEPQPATIVLSSGEESDIEDEIPEEEDNELMSRSV